MNCTELDDQYETLYSNVCEKSLQLSQELAGAMFWSLFWSFVVLLCSVMMVSTSDTDEEDDDELAEDENDNENSPPKQKQKTVGFWNKDSVIGAADTTLDE